MSLNAPSAEMNPIEDRSAPAAMADDAQASSMPPLTLPAAVEARDPNFTFELSPIPQDMSVEATTIEQDLEKLLEKKAKQDKRKAELGLSTPPKRAANYPPMTHGNVFTNQQKPEHLPLNDQRLRMSRPLQMTQSSHKVPIAPLDSKKQIHMSQIQQKQTLPKKKYPLVQSRR